MKRMRCLRLGTGSAVLALAGLLLPILSGCRDTPSRSAETESPAGDSREVNLDEEAVRAAGIEAVPVSREAFRPHLVASGVIRPDAQRHVVVHAPAPGRVMRVLADVGDTVRSGQSLAILEGPEVPTARARHRTAAAREASARAASERADRLLELKAISRAEAEARRTETEAAAAEADAARQDLIRLGLDPGAGSTAGGGPAEFRITAPLPGEILRRNVSPGLLIEKETLLFEIADLSRVWALVDVYEKDLGRIRGEGEVGIRTDAFPDEVFTGRIALVEPALDEAARTVHVRVVLDNRSGRLRPGLFVMAAIPLRDTADGQVASIPVEALQRFSGMTAVFVEKTAGRYELRMVETAREANGRVEILRGLEEGERVVARGAFALKSELLKGSIEGEEH